MNAPSALELKVGGRSQREASRAQARPGLFAGLAARAGSVRRIKISQVLSGPAPGYRIGDEVDHRRFGIGRVVAQWPDGRLLVRFDCEIKNRLVFPSFLNRVNHRRR